jgi:Transposase IS4
MKNKPISEGYKIFALCDHGYTYTFLPTSRVQQNAEVRRVDGITYTGCIVLHLVLQLPYRDKTFNIFMDNYFSSVPLFSYLRAKGIGACGTVRPNSRGFPKELKVSKRVKMDWNFRSGVVVDDVLAMLWMDNGPVTMLTTIHELEGNAWEIEKERKRPRKSTLNSTKVREVFGDNYEKNLKIPRVIDEYNQHMGGVDLADQLRSYYDSQLTCRRNWMPLFFWLLDIALVNSFKLAALKGSKKSQVEFRKELLWSLIERAQ